LRITDETLLSREWCVFRNLVHAVYREARHLGPLGDYQARVTVSKGSLLTCANRCRQERLDLKSAKLYRLTEKATNTNEVLGPYQEKTGLTLDDLILLFKLPNWRQSYGGPKWVTIAETLGELVTAFISVLE